MKMNRIILFILLVALLVTSCASPAPAPVPTVTVADAVATVEKFYKIINDAQTQDGLIPSWVMLTSEEQCNPRDQCTLAFFQKNWWQWKVVYSLYGCSPTHVVAQETLIPREDNATSTPPAPRYWGYQLIETESGMMISDRRLVQAPEDDCVLMVDNSQKP